MGDSKVSNTNNLITYADSPKIDYQIHITSITNSTLFGSVKQNERGTLLEDFMAQYGMIPANIGKKNTFVRGTTGTVFDTRIPRSN